LLLCGGIPPPFLYSGSVYDIVASVRDIGSAVVFRLGRRRRATVFLLRWSSLGLMDFAVLRGCCFWVEVSVVVAACGDWCRRRNFLFYLYGLLIDVLILETDLWIEFWISGFLSFVVCAMNVWIFGLMLWILFWVCARNGWCCSCYEEARFWSGTVLMLFNLIKKKHK
jgi:hypothetical protein